MENHECDSNLTMTEVKPEPIDFGLSAPYYGYSTDCDNKNSESMVNKEEYTYGSVAEIKLDTIDGTQIISNTGIACKDINIKLDLSDDFSCSRVVPDEEEEEDTSESGEKSYEVFSKPIDFEKPNETGSELKHCEIYTKDCEINKGTLKRIVPEKERFKCTICSMRFNTRKAILKHMQVHVKKKMQEAEISIFQRRRNRHTVKNYKCQICTDHFKRKCDLFKHMEIHAGKKSFKCEMCTRCFTTKRNLSNHMKTHPGERNFKCEVCMKCVTTKYSLINHIKIHTGERSHKCEICIKSFVTKARLLKHMITHTGEKNYKCKHCNKYFVSNQNLSIHMNVHTGERTYKCEICRKCLTTKRTLSNHMKIHRSDKSYKCEVCAKCFKRKGYLAIHMNIHTGDRNYKCAVCAKCFRTKHQISFHMKKHTVERNYKCEICSKCFITEQNLSKHRKMHAEKPNVFLKENTEEGPLQKLINVAHVDKIESGLSKEETSTYIKKENLELDYDTVERKPLTITYNCHNDAEIMDEKPNSKEILDLQKGFTSEIIIKEEENTVSTTSYVN